MKFPATFYSSTHILVAWWYHRFLSDANPPDLVVSTQILLLQQVTWHASRALIGQSFPLDGVEIIDVTKPLCQQLHGVHNDEGHLIHLFSWCIDVIDCQNRGCLTKNTIIVSSPNLIHGQTRAQAYFLQGGGPIIVILSLFYGTDPCSCWYIEFHSYDLPPPERKKLKLVGATIFW